DRDDRAPWVEASGQDTGGAEKRCGVRRQQEARTRRRVSPARGARVDDAGDGSDRPGRDERAQADATDADSREPSHAAATANEQQAAAVRRELERVPHHGAERESVEEGEREAEQVPRE